MTNIPPKKPVNDLIKFWAEKQEKTPETISKSSRKSSSPNTSLPPSPRNDVFIQKSITEDIPSNSSEGNNNSVDNNGLSIIDIQTLPQKNEQGRMDWSSLPQNGSSNEETSTSPLSFLALKSIPPVPAKNSYITRPRDHNLDTKDASSSKTSSLPPVRKVTDLVTKFENVSPPTNSVTPSPRLTPTNRSQTYAQSPTSLAVKRNQPTPKSNSNILSEPVTEEPTSISSSLASPIKHTISNQDYESTPVTPIPPIGDEMPKVKPVASKESKSQKKLPQQALKKGNNTSTQKKVTESNINLPPIKQSDPEPLRQTRPTSKIAQNPSFNQTNQDNSSEYIPKYSDETGFILPEITPVSPFWKPTTKNTPTSPLWNPKNGNTPVSPLRRPVTEMTIQNSQTDSQNKTFASRKISNVKSKTTPPPFSPSESSSLPDLLPRPEPISPIRLSFSDFLRSPNGSSTDLNSCPPLDNKDQLDMYKVVVGPKSGDKKKQSLPSAKDTNAFIMEMHETNMQQSRSVPEKDEFSSTVKPIFMKPISGTIQLIENLRHYLQPNKYKDSVDVNESVEKSTSQNINSNEEYYVMTISLNKSGSFQTYNSKGSVKSRKRQNNKPVRTSKFLYRRTRPNRNSLSPVNTLKRNPSLVKNKTLNNTGHDLPEYNTSKSQMSMLVPHNLSSVEYGKINRSLPDLSVRHRHHNFNDVFHKNNMTVPDFTRVSSISDDEPKRPDFTMAIMTDAELDPSKITKFSIDPFDESESNEIFKPNAPWIHLPHLDEFIESLPPTEFSEPKDLMTAEEYEKFIEYGKKFDNKVIEDMFPPMNQIPSGICLDDLKQNILKHDGLLSQKQKNNLLDAAIDAVLAGQSSTAGMKMTRLEIIRDFIQILALALSFANTNVLKDWKNTILATIPSLLSLNWSYVFGNGIAFFLAFCVITLGCLYWFRIMTKYDPNADVEGFESHPWNIRPEPKRRQNIIVVFVLTTLYLPLSKLSLDALVWSESFWPVPNPYDVDFPNFEKSGSDTIRNPQDFCYVTSMNKEDLNFAPVIIAIALITVCVFTFWFPIALKSLVDKNLPRVDKYNEMGETRHNPHVEYRRLLDKDTCPYNFLYNAYNEKWAAYKTFIMANKFFLVFLVSVISKDNCLFRSFPRTRIDTILYSLQIVFMVILYIIHWKYEPFLYRSQNLSEHWSRAGYVVTSSLGLLIVLKVGPERQLNIALVVVTILFFAVVVWHIVIHTDRYKSFIKSIRKRLDFSLNIYSPKLDFAKHIKRRLWQETWSILLLTSEQFKMYDGKAVAFSQSPFRPPYLLNFSGTVAERHVENLKIIRQIGIKNYTSAMAPLSESLVKLRSIIVNNFVGPDMYYAPEFFALDIKTCFGKAYVVPFPFSIVMVYDEGENVLVLTQEWEIQRYVQQNENKEVQRRRLIRQKLRALEGRVILGPTNERSDDELNIDKEPIHYCRGILSIQRNKESKWQNYNMNPGFKVTVSYTDTQSPHEYVVGHDTLGITDDFQMTYQLQKLLSDNEEIVQEGLIQVQKIMNEYRQYYKNEAQWKEETLSYGFFINIYDNPSIPLESLPALLITTEENPSVQSIPESEYPNIIYLYERMRVVNLSRIHQWWYLFWEDLWRKNHKEIPELIKNPQYFSPHYRKSLCYFPMTRIRLEEFLEKRGSWKNGGKNGFLHSGVLNRIYLYLNNVVFGEKSRKNGAPKKWNISRGNTIEQDGISFGHARRTMRKRMMVMKDIMLRRNNFSRTRPFFVIHEEEDSDSENSEQSDTSDGINSVEEIW